MPARPPVQATIHGRIAREGYSIEKVAFESFPGHVVTGNLYRPTGTSSRSAPQPGVLCPYGHWPNGRFIDMPASIRDKYQYHTLADLSRLRQAGWNAPMTSLEEGVAKTVAILASADPFR